MKHFSKKFVAASENMLFFHVFYFNWTEKAMQLIDKYVVQVFQPFSHQKSMKKQLKFEIRHDHSLDDQKKLPPASARCASENQNYTTEYGQCSPALMTATYVLLWKTNSHMIISPVLQWKNGAFVCSEISCRTIMGRDYLVYIYFDSYISCQTIWDEATWPTYILILGSTTWSLECTLGWMKTRPCFDIFFEQILESNSSFEATII